MTIRRIKAVRQTIAPRYFPQHDIDADKVARIEAAIDAGVTLPPVVAVQYGDSYMPIDGHHRFEASARKRKQLDAWVISGRAFESLDQRCRDECDFMRAEDYIMCGNVTAMEVAPRAREPGTGAA